MLFAVKSAEEIAEKLVEKAMYTEYGASAAVADLAEDVEVIRSSSEIRLDHDKKTASATLAGISYVELHTDYEVMKGILSSIE